MINEVLVLFYWTLAKKHENNSCCCVRESASKPTSLTQASQARLCEICRDANPQSARGHRSGREFWSLGEGSSRLGEWDSPKREIVCNCVFWLNNSRRRGWLCFEREYVSPKRDPLLSEVAREGLWFWGTRHLDEALLFWANESLAQASMSSPNG